MRTSVADSMNSPSSSTEPSLMYMDVKVEAIMPRVVFEASKEASVMQRDRPKTMQIQVSRFAITNIREMGASRADLAQAIHSLQEGTLVFSTGFPSKPDDLSIVTDKILSHIAATDMTSSMPPDSPSSFFTLNQLSRYALWNDTRDVWCIKIDPVWIEFLGIRSIGASRTIPFIDAVPITLWIHGKSDIDSTIGEKMMEQQMQQHQGEAKKRNEMILSVQSLGHASPQATDGFSAIPNVPKPSIEDDKSADLHVIAHFENLVSVQIDHYQFLFLMRLAEELNELTTFLSIDSKRIMQEAPNKSVIIGCVIPQVEVTLVMPSQTPGKESSGGDGESESVMPDSVSLGGDLHATNRDWNQSFSLDSQSRVLNAFSSMESPSPVKEKNDFAVENKSNIKFNIPEDHEGQHAAQNQNLNSNSSSSSSNATLKNKKVTSDSSIIPKELNSGLNQMRKGFTSFMTSIETAVKTNASFDDGSDTISIQSDYSDDSELFTVLADTDKATTDCNDFMFKLNPFSSDANGKLAPVEVASEVCEDPFLTNMSSPSEPSDASSLKRRDLVSMTTFR